MKHGYKQVKLLPEIYKNEKVLRLRYYGEKDGSENLTKCPDCNADCAFIEFKRFGGSVSSINDRIRDAAKKSSIVVIRLLRELPEGFLNDHIPGRKALYANLKMIILMNGDRWLEF